MRARPPSPPPPPGPQDLYTFGRCKHAHPLATLKQLGVPLPAEEAEVLLSGVAWDEFKVGT
jgi:hypothetical protein